MRFSHSRMSGCSASTVLIMLPEEAKMGLVSVCPWWHVDLEGLGLCDLEAFEMDHERLRAQRRANKDEDPAILHSSMLILMAGKGVRIEEDEEGWLLTVGVVMISPPAIDLPYKKVQPWIVCECYKGTVLNASLRRYPPNI